MVPVLSDYHLAYSFFSVSHDVMLEVVGVICGVMGSRSPHKDTNNTITQEFVLMTKPNTEHVQPKEFSPVCTSKVLSGTNSTYVDHSENPTHHSFLHADTMADRRL